MLMEYSIKLRMQINLSLLIQNYHVIYKRKEIQPQGDTL